MPEPLPQPETELHRQRETIRRNMLQANTAVAVVLCAVLLLAVAAVLASVGALRNQRRTEDSEQQKLEQLWPAYFEQARASRLSGLAGSRRQALTALRNAAAIRPGLELRTEATTALGLTDPDAESSVGTPVPGNVRSHDVAPDFTRFVRVFRSGRSEWRRLADGSLLAAFEPEPAGLGTNRVVTWARISPGVTIWRSASWTVPC